MSDSKVWFITGTSSGLRRALAEEISAQDGRVAAPLGLDAFEAIEEKLERVKQEIAP